MKREFPKGTYPMPDVTFESLVCKPLTTHTGADIEFPANQTVATNLSAETTAELIRALGKYKVVFLRNLDFDYDQLLAFSRQFGELMELPYIRPVSGHPEIIAVLKEADEVNMGVFGGDWHSDFSFLAAPPSYSILHSKEVPEFGGDTVWVNMAAAFAALDDNTQDSLRSRYAVHTGAPYGVANAPPEETQFKGSIQMDRNNPEADLETFHPAVCVHPETGEEVLFISPTYTIRFGDRDRAASEGELQALYAHCTRPEFSCRFRWEPGVIAIWDNRSTMHYAVNDYDGHRRLLHRTAIRGNPPVGTARLQELETTRVAKS